MVLCARRMYSDADSSPHRHLNGIAPLHARPPDGRPLPRELLSLDASEGSDSEEHTTHTTCTTTHTSATLVQSPPIHSQSHSHLPIPVSCPSVPRPRFRVVTGDSLTDPMRARRDPVRTWVNRPDERRLDDRPAPLKKIIWPTLSHLSFPSLATCLSRYPLAGRSLGLPSRGLTRCA